MDAIQDNGRKNFWDDIGDQTRKPQRTPAPILPSFSTLTAQLPASQFPSFSALLAQYPVSSPIPPAQRPNLSLLSNVNPYSPTRLQMSIPLNNFPQENGAYSDSPIADDFLEDNFVSEYVAGYNEATENKAKKLSEKVDEVKNFSFSENDLPKDWFLGSAKTLKNVIAEKQPNKKGMKECKNRIQVLISPENEMYIVLDCNPLSETLKRSLVSKNYHIKPEYKKINKAEARKLWIHSKISTLIGTKDETIRVDKFFIFKKQ